MILQDDSLPIDAKLKGVTTFHIIDTEFVLPNQFTSISNTLTKNIASRNIKKYGQYTIELDWCHIGHSVVQKRKQKEITVTGGIDRRLRCIANLTPELNSFKTSDTALRMAVSRAKKKHTPLCNTLVADKRSYLNKTRDYYRCIVDDLNPLAWYSGALKHRWLGEYQNQSYVMLAETESGVNVYVVIGEMKYSFSISELKLCNSADIEQGYVTLSSSEIEAQMYDETFAPLDADNSQIDESTVEDVPIVNDAAKHELVTVKTHQYEAANTILDQDIEEQLAQCIADLESEVA